MLESRDASRDHLHSAFSVCLDFLSLTTVRKPMVVSLLSYISPCHKAHEAFTVSFHPLRFVARVVTFAHDFHPAVLIPPSVILLHLVFGRPGPSSLFWPPLQSCNAMFLSVFPRYMTNPVPSSTSDLIARSVHFCVCWWEMV